MLPAHEATIPVFDAGFVLGATVTEQLRTFGGKLFRFDEHLLRLHRSLSIVGIDPGLSDEELGRIARAIVAHNHALLAPGDDLGLSLFVTPGPYATLAPEAAAGPTIGLHTYPLPFRLWTEKYERGESLVISDVEQVSPRSWPPELKCRSRMHYFLAEQHARKHRPGARALLLNASGGVTETLTSNVLAYRRDVGLISPLPERILRGISLSMVRELAEKLRVPFVEHELTAHELAGADEVLLTSTPSCLLPVTMLDGQPIGNCRPGPIFGRLIQAWSELVGLDIMAQSRQFARR
jgi:branched-subunit amino acid aminotransferase/4-amino-4-deoxychorismate lyase